MRDIHYLLIRAVNLSACLLLAGCVTQNQGVLSSQSSTGGGANPKLLVMAPPTNGQRTMNKVAISGQPVMIIESYALNPDCSLRGMNTLRVTQPPAHGKVAIVQKDVFPQYPPNSPFAVCNNTKHPGLEVTYTSENSFTGADFMKIERISIDGTSAEYNINITIK